MQLIDAFFLCLILSVIKREIL